MLYDAFSKRNQVLPDVFVYDAMPIKFRNQVNWIWKDSVKQIYSRRSGGGMISFPTLILASERVCAEHGLPHLGDKLVNDGGEVKGLLTENNNSVVLDLIEFSFSISLNYLESGNRKGLEGKMSEAIQALNHRFRENGLGYEFNESAQKLIRVDNMVTHQEIIRPALALLSDKKYEVPNKEFLEALEDFKKGEYHDCLTKCGSSFESIMKIIWEEKQPPHDPKATASALLNKMRELFPDIPTFFVQPLSLIATTRNQLSGSHGGGTTLRQPPDYIARYTLNATASAILFIHEASIS